MFLRRYTYPSSSPPGRRVSALAPGPPSIRLGSIVQANPIERGIECCARTVEPYIKVILIVAHIEREVREVARRCNVRGNA